MRFHANLNCDKLWISYAACCSISPRRAACEIERIFPVGSRRLSVSGKTICFDLEGEVSGPFCEASLRLCCAAPVCWWEALDLSRIAQPLSGPWVHCYELRRAMNSRSCLSLLPEPAGVLRRVSHTQHEKCLLLQHWGALMKQL